MTAAWQRGERPRAEDILARHPELLNSPQQAIRLVYEEICLRAEAGEAVDSVEVLGRFPQWRDELEVVLNCHRVMEIGAALPFFPEAGQVVGPLKLLAELGRGAQGRVFLAAQQDLADRPVVLKMTAGDSDEHLSLARMGHHTHIVPLYWKKDFAELGLHVLCMPYLGGASLARLLELVQEVPLSRRHGRDLVSALDQAQAGRPAVFTGGPARQLLARLDYPEAICWLVGCLAEALHYAHERHLVHLDLKPGNVLVAGDGQPMLLDFHLAREPIPVGPPPTQIGGTTGYMAPELQAALEAVRTGQRITVPVDGRADLFSVGVILYQALSDRLPGENEGKVSPNLPTAKVGSGPRKPGPSQARGPSCDLSQLHPRVSPGLADIIARCLELDPARRYPSAAELRADLLRHLQAQPLRGVANRSLAERWRKWRRRRPYAGRLIGLAAAVVLLIAAVGITAGLHFRQRWADAQSALDTGQTQLREQEPAEAIRSLSHGLTLARDLPGGGDLAQALEAELHKARRAEVARRLHEVAEQVRFRFDPTSEAPAGLLALEQACREVWEARRLIADRGGAELADAVEQQLRTDLLDLAILWAELRVRVSGGAATPLTPDPSPPRGEGNSLPPSPLGGEGSGVRGMARRQALDVLVEAEQLGGPSHVLYRERARHAAALGQAAEAATAERQAAARPPQTAWEYYTLGRCLLLAGAPEEAATALERAVELQPQGFWPHFYQGLAAYQQGRYVEAVRAFHVCTALAPTAAECYYNRGRAAAALGDAAHARHDYDRALELQPTLAPAAFNRGLLHAQEEHYSEAVADLHQALANGADPVAVHYQLALIHKARGDRTVALAHVEQVLRQAPDHAGARQLKAALASP